MRGERVGRRRILAPSTIALLVLALVLAAQFAHGNGSDLPPQIVLRGFLKPEDGHLVLLVRIPLVLLAGFSLPKRGPGYLDLARIDVRLTQAVAAVGRQIELFEGDARLSPARAESRLSLPSDASFESFAAARAHLQGPTLPIDTDLYWNQGFLDAELEYPITSSQADFSVRASMSPELADRIKLHLEFLSARGPVRSYDLPGRSRRVPLDPRWYEAAWTFARAGFAAPFAINRLVFLLCLVMPYRRFWSLLAVVMAMTGLQTVSLGVGAWGGLPHGNVLGPLFETCLAAAVLLLAIENVVAPSLRRRWLVASVVGVLGGFDVGHRLADEWQFAGAHAVASGVSFSVGVALGEVAALVLALGALGALFRYTTGQRLCVIVLSAILGHLGWHWMMDAGHRMEHAAATVSIAAMAAVSWWVLLGLLVGGAAWFLPKRFGGAPILPLWSNTSGGDDHGADRVAGRG
jgi:hypothetical protein